MCHYDRCSFDPRVFLSQECPFSTPSIFHDVNILFSSLTAPPLDVTLPFRSSLDRPFSQEGEAMLLAFLHKATAVSDADADSSLGQLDALFTDLKSHGNPYIAELLA